MKFITRTLVLLSLLLIAVRPAFATDTLHVITHNKARINTDPSGNKHFPVWAQFPSNKTDVRRIVLHVTFAHPDTGRIADWDYSDGVYIRRRGSYKNNSEDLEMARMLTPYGGAFDKSWHFEWTVDVTDFSHLLRDSVEIEYRHSGYEPAAKAWAVTLDFEIIKGPPAIAPVSITKIYDSNYPYGNKEKPFDSLVRPVVVTMGKYTNLARLRIFQTGHGMDETANCAEFCSKYRDILWDNKLADHKVLWKKCGENPLYPQAGTWIFDRANWCPGNLLIPDVYDWQVKPSESHTVCLQMEKYEAAKPTANQSISAYLIQYKKPEAKYDVSIEDVITPSRKDVYLRLNPSCASPRIVIKNLGSETLRSATISWTIDGGPRQYYSWSGMLASFQTATVDLPGAIATNKSKGVFEVQISEPNGHKDAWEGDNTARTTFLPVPVYEKDMVFAFRSNKHPNDNSWVLRDATGTPVYERKLGKIAKDTMVLDTFHLIPGCYELTVSDTARDGLEFWAVPEQGRGYCRLLTTQGELLKNFDGDFGTTIHYNFTVSETAKNVIDTMPAIALFPTRTTGITTLDLFQNIAQDTRVEITTDSGKPVETHLYRDLKAGVFTYDLSYRAPQRYYLKVYTGDVMHFNKRIRVMKQ